MDKVFGLATLELPPGVRGEEFERFWTDECAPLGAMLGLIGHVARGDRGERAGKYAIIWEIPSIEARDRCFPTPAYAHRRCWPCWSQS